LRNPDTLKVSLGAGAAVTALVYRSAGDGPGATLILGHGAGAGQSSPFMVAFADALSLLGLDVVTFNFLYTEQRRKLPDRRPALEACYNAVINAARGEIATAGEHLFIGGKSMGGRIATHVAAADGTLPLAGLVLLGYPLHPPGRPDQRRDAHLVDVRRPMLIVQGSRDAFGTPAELEPVISRLSSAATLHVVQGGDHSFKVAKAGQRGQAAVHADVQQTIAAWVRHVTRATPGMFRRPD
jgi:predicted alpha/beta-hydrolase family hydrolase